MGLICLCGIRNATNHAQCSASVNIPCVRVHFLQVTRERDPSTGQQALLFQIDYPEIADGVQPRHRFMSAYEQKIQPPDKRFVPFFYPSKSFFTTLVLGGSIFYLPPSLTRQSDSRFRPGRVWWSAAWDLYVSCLLVWRCESYKSRSPAASNRFL